MKFSIAHQGSYSHPQDPEQFDSRFWRAAEGPRRSFGHAAKAVLSLALVLGFAISCGTLKDAASISHEEEYNTGYGMVGSRGMAGSASHLDIEENVVASYSTIYDYLKGRVAGLIVDDTAGGTPRILIRGKKSIWQEDDAPLIMVNGHEHPDISDIDPNFVESVDVLKDPTMTSLYGSRGANGVIIINLKK